MKPSQSVAAWQLGLPLLDSDGDTDSADEAPDLAALTVRDPARARVLLEELADAARAAAQRETKVGALVRLLRRIGEPVVVFTEYRDTLQNLERRIGRPAAVLHGGLSRDERAAALEDFVNGRRLVLLATDAAGEGLNLHHTCRVVINLELPWNPMRLEQRIGRVDRIGQRRRVHAIHLIARDTNECEVLERLRVRVARAQNDVGAADPLAAVNERTIAQLMIDSVRFGTGDAELATATPGLGAADSELETGNPMTLMTSLKAEGEAEAARLAHTRRLLGGNAAASAVILPANDMWLTFARTRTTRIGLGKRVLFLFRAVCEDGCGRLLESALVPVAVDWPDDSSTRAALGDFVTRAAPAALAQARTAISIWRTHATLAARHILDARVVRERAIATLRDQLAAQGVSLPWRQTPIPANKEAASAEAHQDKRRTRPARAG